MRCLFQSAKKVSGRLGEMCMSFIPSRRQISNIQGKPTLPEVDLNTFLREGKRRRNLRMKWIAPFTPCRPDFCSCWYHRTSFGINLQVITAERVWRHPRMPSWLTFWVPQTKPGHHPATTIVARWYQYVSNSKQPVDWSAIYMDHSSFV